MKRLASLGGSEAPIAVVVVVAAEEKDERMRERERERGRMKCDRVVRERRRVLFSVCERQPNPTVNKKQGKAM